MLAQVFGATEAVETPTMVSQSQPHHENTLKAEPRIDGPNNEEMTLQVEKGAKRDMGQPDETRVAKFLECKKPTNPIQRGVIESGQDSNDEIIEDVLYGGPLLDEIAQIALKCILYLNEPELTTASCAISLTTTVTLALTSV